MAQAMVNFRVDSELKKSMEQVCKEMGLNMSTALTIFISRVVKDRKIPFEVTAEPDPFYSEANMARLRRGIEALNNGEGIERELIEVDDDEEDLV